MTDQLVGASVWEQSLYEHLCSHESNERELLLEYQNAASESGSAAFRYLASLIVEDEIRHHRVFRELAESLRADVEMSGDDPAVPRLGGWGRDPHKVIELGGRLAHHEEADLKALRIIRRDMDSVRDTTLWALLVRLMELDTEKHLEILDFARRHAKEAVGRNDEEGWPWSGHST
ncbi:MAG TPA: hypothetical protein VFP54_12355 [Acidimicrobiales bacterium]|nr:hypothetical protein [Acidimicrobiales bacterium]